MSGKSGSFVPTEPRNTYLFRRAKFRSPVPDRRYSPFKEIYFFPAVQFVQKESPCEWKRTFSPLFFSYQLNELFFIHPTTLRHPTFSLFFLPSDTLASVLPLVNVFFYFSPSLRTFPFSCILWFLAAFSLLRIIRWPVTSFFCTRTFSLLCCLFTFTS